MRKPNADIYEYTLNRLGVDATDAIFVDDSIENIETAERLGLTVHLFTTADDAIGAVRGFLTDLT